MEWQPIETAPKDGTAIWVPDDEGGAVRVLWHDGFSSFVSGWRRMDMAHGLEMGRGNDPDWLPGKYNDGRHYYDHSPERYSPTCWMPIPNPPEGTP